MYYELNVNVMEDFDELFGDHNLDDLEPINEELNENLEDNFKEDELFDSNSPEVPSLLDEFLKTKGINDSKILIIDENNEEKEVDFYSLSKEEQLDILNSQKEVEQITTPTQLAKDQDDFINYLKDNNLSLQEYLDKYKELVLSEVQGSQESYSIDAYDDEELFLFDLKNKYDLSDEELVKELEKALEDKDVFTKKVTKLRADYKEQEDYYKQEQEKEFNSQREEQYNQFVDTMVDVATKTPDLYGIELEDEEKYNVLSFLLELDDNGTSNFYKALNDPENLYKAAWFLTYGSKAFEVITNAYEAEISKLKKR